MSTEPGEIMSPFWQTTVALSFCFVAALYVSFRAYRAFAKRASGCGGGGCHSCPSGENASGAKIKTLLPLETHRAPDDSVR